MRTNRLIKVIIFICIMLFSSSLLATAEKVTLKTYKDPMGYFELSMPEGWVVQSSNSLGQMFDLFTPTKISEKDSKEGSDTKGLFFIRITRLNTEQMKMQAENLYKLVIDAEVSGALQNGLKQTAEALGPTKVAGLPGYSFVIRGADELRYNFAYREKHLLYEVIYAYDVKYEAEMKPLLETMRASVQFFSPQCPPEQIKYSAKDLAIELPNGWSVKEQKDGDVTETLISREKVVKSSDRIQVGMTLLKIKNFKKRSGNSQIKTDADIVDVGVETILSQFDQMSGKVFDSQKVFISGMSGYRWEQSFQIPGDKAPTQIIQLVLAKDGTLYSISFEAPVEQFELYREAFEKAIQSLQLK